MFNLVILGFTLIFGLVLLTVIIAVKLFVVGGYVSDIDQEAKAFVIDNFGLESTHDIQDLINTEKRFDIIFSDNVIEHVPDYKAYVKNLTSKLNRGGTLLIKTPHGRNTEIFMNPFYVFKEIFKKSIKYNSFPATVRSIYRRIWHCDPPRLRAA